MTTMPNWLNVRASSIGPNETRIFSCYSDAQVVIDEKAMQADFDRFGIPVENIKAAERWATKQRGKYQYHTRVPTRKEVSTLSPQELAPLLIGWMVHSPTEIIPSRVQVELVLELLNQRRDVADLSNLVAMCQNYIRGQ